ncbi:lysozyme inhibitor LprI family protein [Cupriavidus necator]|uniref:lysozyme inhibitor LprI family protein n=1 Tax=Cupriavidus necator TaxID=106590 RepID=UPI0039C4DB91
MPDQAKAAAQTATTEPAATVAARPDTPSTVTAAPAPVAVEPPQTVIEASFDCGKAASKIEKLICSAPDTAAADKRLAVAYSAAKAKAADTSGLKAEQVEWMKSQRNACADSACLLKATEDRIQKLSAL